MLTTTISFCKQCVSFCNNLILLWILLIFFIIPSANTCRILLHLSGLIQIPKINKSLFGFILIKSGMNFLIFLLIENDFLDLILIKLIGKFFNKIRFFIHFRNNKIYRILDKIYFFLFCIYIILLIYIYLIYYSIDKFYFICFKLNQNLYNFVNIKFSDVNIIMIKK